jgi:hypothetical protein
MDARELGRLLCWVLVVVFILLAVGAIGGDLAGVLSEVGR